MSKFFLAFDSILERISRWGLVLSLFTILGFAIFSIVLRWLGMSPQWIEPLIRHIVFLSAFLGGSLATSKNVHIKIDLLTKLLERSSSKLLHWLHKNLVCFFCFVTTLVLMKASWDFYLVEKEYGAVAFLNIHSSYLVFIIPFGIALIALRFFNQLMLGLLNGDKIELHRI